MPQTSALLSELKRALRAAGLTYGEVGRKLGLSEASVKRLFHEEGFSLKRLEATCELAGLELSDLVERMKQAREPLTELNPEQETELLGDPKLLLITYLVLNKWPFDDIVRTFQIDEHEGFRLLRRLEKLQMIDLLPFNKVRLRTARNFSWRPDGPMQRFLTERVLPEFLASRFEGTGEEQKFVGGLLSRASLLQLQRSIARLVAEFDELAALDARLPRDERRGCSALFALRPWEFSGFARLRR